MKCDESLNVKIQEVNSYLTDKCEFYNIDFISNENISVKYLHSDGVHLNDVGSNLLQENFGKYIFSAILLANSDVTLLNENNISTREISPDFLFQIKILTTNQLLIQLLILNIQIKMCL